MQKKEREKGVGFILIRPPFIPRYPLRSGYVFEPPLRIQTFDRNASGDFRSTTKFKVNLALIQ